MSTNAAAFDAELAAMLEREAVASGETVERYIQRAVAARMVAELSRRQDPTLSDLQQRLTEAGLQTADLVVNSSVDEVINNPNRVRAVQQTGLLDSAPNPAFDRIVRMAAEALGTPSAVLSLMDQERIFILSAVGVGAGITSSREVPLGSSITKSAVAAGHTLVIEDASTDATLRDLPFVQNRTVVAYLGMPLVNVDGYAVGSFAVWDTKPRRWGTGHLETLGSFVRMAWMRIFEAPKA